MFWEQQNFGGHKNLVSIVLQFPRVYGPGFNALPGIFTVTNCSALGDS